MTLEELEAKFKKHNEKSAYYLSVGFATARPILIISCCCEGRYRYFEPLSEMWELEKVTEDEVDGWIKDSIVLLKQIGTKARG